MQKKQGIPNCGCTSEFHKSIKKNSANFKSNLTNKSKNISPSFILQKALPKNKWLSSITGTHYFNLSQIELFKLYFWKETDNLNSNAYINDANNYFNSSIKNTPEDYKEQVISSLDTIINLFNKNSEVVANYEDSNIVVYFYNDLTNDAPAGYATIPEFLKSDIDNTYLDGKIIIAMNYTFLNTLDKIKKGSWGFFALLHEFGHAFGLAHPHDDGLGSTVMPGIPLNTEEPFPYAGSAGYNLNNSFVTLMGYNNYSFYLPDFGLEYTNGHPETLMSLDYAALFYLYNLKSYPLNYIVNYGVNTISKSDLFNKSRCIIGSNLSLKIDNSVDNFIFYLEDTQNFSFNNNYLLNYKLNRIPTYYSNNYPLSFNSSVKYLTFNNYNHTFIFVGSILKYKKIIITSENATINFIKKPYIIVKNAGSGFKVYQIKRKKTDKVYFHIFVNPTITTYFKFNY
jgi:hypothetical protein